MRLRFGRDLPFRPAFLKEIIKEYTRMMRRKILFFSWFTVLVSVFVFGGGPLVAQQDVGYFRTRLSPSVAGVFIDGKYQGTAAMFGHRDSAIKLKPGTYSVELVDPRYKTLKATVKIEAGKTATLRRAMEPLAVDTEGPFGDLTSEGFGNAAVYVNGKYYANTRELQNPFHTLLLRPGEYDMKIVSIDGQTLREEKIKINADETLVINKSGGVARRQ